MAAEHLLLQGLYLHTHMGIIIHLCSTCTRIHTYPYRLGAGEDDDGVVHGLPGDGGAAGVHGQGGDVLHPVLVDLLQRHGGVALPHEHLLVVRGAHELPPLVEVGHRVHRPQVVIVLQHDAPRPRVPLQPHSTYTDQTRAVE